MAAWANILRRRYGIIWPISLISDDDTDSNTEEHDT
jgi:hypothetical protein